MTQGSIDKRDRAQSVREVQKYLRAIGKSGRISIPDLTLDGFYGDKTREAVGIFQRKMGIAATGKVDIVTWDILYEEYLQVLSDTDRSEGIFPFEEHLCADCVKSGEMGNIIYILQVMLETLSVVYDFEEQTINGVYDKVTQKNVEHFQEIANLPVRGDVDRATWNALARAYNRKTNKQ